MNITLYKMLKLFVFIFLLGHALACVTIAISYTSQNKMMVKAYNNTVNICNSTHAVSNKIRCGNNETSMTIGDNIWKVVSPDHKSGWNKFVISSDYNGNLLKYGEYNCDQ